MAYTAHSWSAGDPITQEYMNLIEKGIEDAHTIADASAEKIGTGFSANDTITDNISNINTKIGNVTSGSNLASSITSINDKIGGSYSIGNTIADAIDVINSKLGADISNTSGQTVTD